MGIERLVLSGDAPVSEKLLKILPVCDLRNCLANLLPLSSRMSSASHGVPSPRGFPAFVTASLSTVFYSRRAILAAHGRSSGSDTSDTVFRGNVAN
jgi:hypothetical protein